MTLSDVSAFRVAVTAASALVVCLLGFVGTGLLFQMTAIPVESKTHVSEKQTSTQPVVNREAAGLAVCIVGQLSRLEIHTKVKHIFRPLARAVNVDVFTVLEENAYSFVNNLSDVGDAECQHPFTPEEVRRKLYPYHRGGAILQHSESLPHMEYWTNYGTEAGKRHLNRTLRLAGHIRQWEHMETCADVIEKYEANAGGRYATVMKLRDNTIALRAIEPSIFGEAFVQMKSCNSWGGLNDKVLLASRDYLSPAFRGPIRIARRVESGDSRMVSFVKTVINIEQMLLAAINVSNLPVRQLDVEELPVVDGRCFNVSENGFKQWCLVPRWKDCHPADKRHYPTCDFSATPQDGAGRRRRRRKKAGKSGGE